MDVQHRRKAQLLFQAKGKTCSIHGAGGFNHATEVLDVNPIENSFRLLVSKASKPIDLPIDVVKTVWKTENQWCIRLSGRIKVRGGPMLRGVPAEAVYFETEEPMS